MKKLEVSIPIGKDSIQQITDSAGRNTIHAFVNANDLPTDLPTEVNPRPQNTASRVSKQIADGLLQDSDAFHLMNRGLTIIAQDSVYDPKTGVLKLTFGDASRYGVIDGGHTYAVIKENAENLAPDTFVRMEVLTGVKSNLIVDIARARNTSAQVKTESLSNLEGRFDWIKEALKGQGFADKIAYRENEDNYAKPIDVREIIAFLTLFHPHFEDFSNPPVMGYSSKGRCLEMFAQDEFADGYEKLAPLLPDILRLYDFVQLRFAYFYEEIGGFSGLDGKHDKGIKLGKVLEVKQFKNGFPLYYLDATGNFRFPDGWLYPIVAAHRCLISYKYSWKWKADPFKFFDKFGKGLVAMTLESSRSLGRNPNAVGKSKPHWTQVHERCMTYYGKLLGVDLDKEVVLI